MQKQTTWKMVLALLIGITSCRQVGDVSIPASYHRRSRPQPAESTGMVAGGQVARRFGVAREGDREHPRQTATSGGYAPTLAAYFLEPVASDARKVLIG